MSGEVPLRTDTETRTGMPQEQEIPAPVTTIIFLHFATESESSARERRV